MCVNDRLPVWGVRIFIYSLEGCRMTDTKENILMTALHLFARDGYEAVSVRTIAEELGMTKGAL